MPPVEHHQLGIVDFAAPLPKLLEPNSLGIEDFVVSSRSTAARSTKEPNTCAENRCVNPEHGSKLVVDFCQRDQIKAVSLSMPCNLLSHYPIGNVLVYRVRLRRDSRYVAQFRVRD